MGLVANIKAQVHRARNPMMDWTPDRLEKVTLVADWLTWRKSCASVLLWLYLPVTVLDTICYSDWQFAFWFPALTLVLIVMLEPSLAGMLQKTTRGFGLRRVFMRPWLYFYMPPIILAVVIWMMGPWEQGLHISLGGAVTGVAYIVLGGWAYYSLRFGSKTRMMRNALRKLNIQGV